MVIVLNCVGGRIIGPFHQTVKIWSNLLDIQPSDYRYFYQVSDHRLLFVRFRIIGYFLSGFGSSATIHAVSQYSVKYRMPKQAVALKPLA